MLYKKTLLHSQALLVNTEHCEGKRGEKENLVG